MRILRLIPTLLLPLAVIACGGDGGGGVDPDPYTIGNGICESSKGEPSSSPDCPTPEVNTAPSLQVLSASDTVDLGEPFELTIRGYEARDTLPENQLKDATATFEGVAEVRVLNAADDTVSYAHTFSTSGLHSVPVRVEDKKGLSESTTVHVFVREKLNTYRVHPVDAFDHNAFLDGGILIAGSDTIPVENGVAEFQARAGPTLLKYEAIGRMNRRQTVRYADEYLGERLGQNWLGFDGVFFDLPDADAELEIFVPPTEWESPFSNGSPFGTMEGFELYHRSRSNFQTIGTASAHSGFCEEIDPNTGVMKLAYVLDAVPDEIPRGRVLLPMLNQHKEQVRDFMHSTLEDLSRGLRFTLQGEALNQPPEDRFYVEVYSLTGTGTSGNNRTGIDWENTGCLTKVSFITPSGSLAETAAYRELMEGLFFHSENPTEASLFIKYSSAELQITPWTYEAIPFSIGRGPIKWNEAYNQEE